MVIAHNYAKAIDNYAKTKEWQRWHFEIKVIDPCTTGLSDPL